MPGSVPLWPLLPGEPTGPGDGGGSGQGAPPALAPRITFVSASLPEPPSEAGLFASLFGQEAEAQ